MPTPWEPGNMPTPLEPGNMPSVHLAEPLQPAAHQPTAQHPSVAQLIHDRHVQMHQTHSIHDLMCRLSAEVEHLLRENERLRALPAEIMPGLMAAEHPDQESPMSPQRLWGLRKQVPGHARSLLGGLRHTFARVDPQGTAGWHAAVAQRGLGAADAVHSPSKTAELEKKQRAQKPRIPRLARDRLKAEFENLFREEAKEVSAQEVFQLRTTVDREHRLLGDLEHENEVHKYKAAIEAFNEAFGVWEGENPAPHINVDSYIILVYNGPDRIKISDRIADTEVVNTMREIRRVLLGMATARHVANATGTKVADADAEETLGFLQRLVLRLDPLIGLTVILNTVLIGLRCDIAENWPGWFALETACTTVFVLELLLKVVAYGPRRFFVGEDCWWSMFDTLVVSAAVVDFVLTITELAASVRMITVMRMLRYLRLARLLKVIKLKIFRDISLIINGLIVGMRTLLWFSLFLIYFVFVLGVLLTQNFGGNSPESVLCNDPDGITCSNEAFILEKSRQAMFGTLPRSMFTLFRCMTDGYSSTEGVPLAPLLWENYGFAAAMGYVLLTIFVNFGVVNLMAAIFVQNTIEGAKREELRRREAQEAYKVQLAAQMQECMTAFCTGIEVTQATADSQKSWWTWLQQALSTKGTPEPNKQPQPAAVSAEITQNMFEVAITRKDVRNIMDELEITRHNRKALFEVLDADGSGCLEVSELVRGLMKLRNGGEDGNNLVALILAVESLRRSSKVVEEFCVVLDQVISDVLAKVEVLEGSMEELGKRMVAGTGRVAPFLPS